MTLDDATAGHEAPPPHDFQWWMIVLCVVIAVSAACWSAEGTFTDHKVCTYAEPL